MFRPEVITTLRRLGWVMAVVAGAGMIISAVGRKEASNVEALRIAIEPLEGGHLLIKERDILETIDRSFGYHLESRTVGEIDVERLERVLEEDPFILDANAFITANNEINVRVVQRQPVLRIMDNNGLNYYLDADGLKMPLSPHFSARVLVATGTIPPHVTDFLERKHNTLKDLFLLARQIREDEFFQPLFEQVYVSQKGEFTLVPKVGDQKVIFGAYENPEKKLRNLKVFYRRALPYEGWQKYRTISLAFDGQVVCRKR